jgi:hypothetical protein
LRIITVLNAQVLSRNGLQPTPLRRGTRIAPGLFIVLVNVVRLAWLAARLKPLPLGRFWHVSLWKTERELFWRKKR